MYGKIKPIDRISMKEVTIVTIVNKNKFLLDVFVIKNSLLIMCIKILNCHYFNTSYN